MELGHIIAATVGIFAIWSFYLLINDYIICKDDFRCPYRKQEALIDLILSNLIIVFLIVIRFFVDIQILKEYFLYIAILLIIVQMRKLHKKS